MGGFATTVRMRFITSSIMISLSIIYEDLNKNQGLSQMNGSDKKSMFQLGYCLEFALALQKKYQESGYRAELIGFYKSYWDDFFEEQSKSAAHVAVGLKKEGQDWLVHDVSGLRKASEVLEDCLFITDIEGIPSFEALQLEELEFLLGEVNQEALEAANQYIQESDGLNDDIQKVIHDSLSSNLFKESYKSKSEGVSSLMLQLYLEIEKQGGIPQSVEMLSKLNKEEQLYLMNYFFNEAGNLEYYRGMMVHFDLPATGLEWSDVFFQKAEETLHLKSWGAYTQQSSLLSSEYFNGKRIVDEALSNEVKFNALIQVKDEILSDYGLGKINKKGQWEFPAAETHAHFAIRHSLAGSYILQCERVYEGQYVSHPLPLSVSQEMERRLIGEYMRGMLPVQLFEHPVLSKNMLHSQQWSDFVFDNGLMCSDVIVAVIEEGKMPRFNQIQPCNPGLMRRVVKWAVEHEDELMDDTRVKLREFVLSSNFYGLEENKMKEWVLSVGFNWEENYGLPTHSNEFKDLTVSKKKGFSSKLFYLESYIFNYLNSLGELNSRQEEDFARLHLQKIEEVVYGKDFVDVSNEKYFDLNESEFPNFHGTLKIKEGPLKTAIVVALFNCITKIASEYEKLPDPDNLERYSNNYDDDDSKPELMFLNPNNFKDDGLIFGKEEVIEGKVARLLIENIIEMAKKGGVDWNKIKRGDFILNDSKRVNPLIEWVDKIATQHQLQMNLAPAMKMKSKMVDNRF